MTRLRQGKFVQMWSDKPIICPTSIFTPFCFDSCRVPQQKNTSDGGEQGHSLLFSIMCSIFDKKSTVLSLGDEQGYSLRSSILCITFLSSLNILAKFLQSTINLTMDRLLLKIFFQVFSLVQLMTSPFKVSNNGAKIGLNQGSLQEHIYNPNW
jgi:hypothetical protein